MTELMTINDASKTFFRGTPNEVHALNGINLTVNKGDFITLVGGNGAGKSTLLNAISGNFMLDHGTITVEGQDITYQNDIQRAGLIGRIFQDPLMGTAPRMTVAENIALALKRGESRGFRRALTQEKRQEFADLLAPLGLGLENRLDTEIGLLSGGQRQAITLLMATLKKPKLLLLDEHTAALDPKTAQTVLALSDKIVKENNLTAVMITHNLSDALDYGNRVLMLHHGQIVDDFTGLERDNLTTNDIFNRMEVLQQSDLV